ncbi:MAG TPA: hypothetical protein VES00_22495 [Burkholderiaceae bacterium]|jgi:hypothetical protein|nr:hypothetical protein [Burkholderiaceae bacterium]
MTTYTTPHPATGHSNPRSDMPRIRPASAATSRTAAASNDPDALRGGQTPGWQPGASKGVPKAVVGVVGAALVGGVVLAITLLAPSSKVVKHAQPDPIAESRAGATTTPAKVQAPATQQTPDTATVAPTTPDTPAQAPAQSNK